MLESPRKKEVIQCFSDISHNNHFNWVSVGITEVAKQRVLFYFFFIKSDNNLTNFMVNSTFIFIGVSVKETHQLMTGLRLSN